MKRGFLILLCSLVWGALIHSSSSPAAIKKEEVKKGSPIQRLLTQAENLDPRVLTLALNAYRNAPRFGFNPQPTLTIIDYSKPSTEKRLWVLDLEKLKVSYHTLVAHGKNSGDLMATDFSNQMHSAASSLGVFMTGETYRGRHGYSLRLHGLEKGFNDRAYDRDVVIHSAPYVSKEFVKRTGRLGRSQGCPALSLEETPAIIDKIKNGSLIFAYYPDRTWLSQSKFIHRKNARF